MPAPDDLSALPSLEEQSATYGRMVSEFEQRLERELGLAGWSTGQPAGQALCGEGEVEGARIAFLPTRLLPGGVPDDRWAEAVDVLVEVAEPYGFGRLETVVDRPGEHEVVLRGAREALVRFGALENATLDVTTGCHLVEEAGG